jgi:acyl dehydratase
MPINPDAVGTRGEPAETSWTSKDCLLYAVGVGAGTQELEFTTENSIGVDQRVLPTQAVVLTGGIMSAMRNIGSFNPAMLVHGEQGITLHREIPVEGTAVSVAEITAILDKGKGAVIELTITSTLQGTGEPLFDNRFAAFIRGEGGWGGERGPSEPRNVAPERAPDHQVTYQTREDQALTYRLSGDRNPLHSDPEFAKLAGFDRPILHGLCTYGFTGRALLHTLCDSDPARFGGMDGRFSSPVMPGESLTISMWADGDGAIFQTAGEDGRVVLDNGRVTVKA